MEGEPAAYGRWNLRMTAEERRSIRKRLIKGGKIADQMRKMAKLQHEVEELPEAEDMMAQGLASETSTKTENIFKNPHSEEKLKTHWWQHVLHFFQTLLIP